MFWSNFLTQTAYRNIRRKSKTRMRIFFHLLSDEVKIYGKQINEITFTKR